MKKIVLMMLALLLCLGALAAPAALAEDKPTVVATTFPIYDWARQIIGGEKKINLVLLLNNGIDLHNYNPTASDIRTVNNCDLFIYIGGESDAWVDDILRVGDNDQRQTLCLMEALGDAAKEEEVKEGMEQEEEEEEEAASDEHIWLSLRNAQTLCGAITDALAAVCPEDADTFRTNNEAYCAQLSDLDGQYADMIGASAYDTLLFCDRFPFRYFVDDYNLEYYAAFPGCSAATDISIETIRFLRNKVDELNLPAVLLLEGSDTRFAETVLRESQNKDRPIIMVNSMQGVTTQDVEQGATYLAIMQDNLDAFRAALN